MRRFAAQHAKAATHGAIAAPSSARELELRLFFGQGLMRRLEEGRKIVRSQLQRVGLDMHSFTRPTTRDNERPVEIADWIRDHQSRGGVQIETFVVLDDRDLFKEQGGLELEGHFVKTRLTKGLTVQAMEA